jgi:hypothetical protein
MLPGTSACAVQYLPQSTRAIVGLCGGHASAHHGIDEHGKPRCDDDKDHLCGPHAGMLGKRLGTGLG